MPSPGTAAARARARTPARPHACNMFQPAGVRGAAVPASRPADWTAVAEHLSRRRCAAWLTHMNTRTDSAVFRQQTRRLDVAEAGTCVTEAVSFQFFFFWCVCVCARARVRRKTDTRPGPGEGSDGPGDRGPARSQPNVTPPRTMTQRVLWPGTRWPPAVFLRQSRRDDGLRVPLSLRRACVTKGLGRLIEHSC